MPKEMQTDLFEADGVTPKVKDKTAQAAEALLALERKAARAEGESAGLKAALAAKPAATTKQTEKALTRQELRVKVNAGEITEDQMDDILERQFEAKLSKKVEETVESRVSSSQSNATVESQIQAYVSVFPDINKDGSATRAKIEAEYIELVKNKSPETIGTELAAIKIVCGQLKAGAGHRPAPDSHEDVGGGGGEGNERPDTQGWAKGLTPRQKAHYDKMIAKGVYSGTKDKMLVRELTRIRGSN